MCVHIHVVCMCTYIFACVYTRMRRPLVDFRSLGVLLDQLPPYTLRQSLSLSPELCDLVRVAGQLAPGAPWVVLALAGFQAGCHSSLGLGIRTPLTSPFAEHLPGTLFLLLKMHVARATVSCLCLPWPHHNCTGIDRHGRQLSWVWCLFVCLFVVLGFFHYVFSTSNTKWVWITSEESPISQAPK